MSSFNWNNRKRDAYERGLAGGPGSAIKPRILYFAPKEFWPPDTGAKVRNYHLAREMTAYADVTYLAFSDGSDAPAAESVWLRGEGYYRHRLKSVDPEGAIGEFERIVTVHRAPRYRWSKILQGAISRTPVTVLNYTTPEMSKCLATILGEGDFDIVHMAGLHLSSYLPIIREAKSRPAVVCDWHNVESEVMQRYSAYAPSLAHRIYASNTARRLRDLEQKAIGQFDIHTVVSARDQIKLLEINPDAPVHVVENGVDVDRYTDPALECAYYTARLPRMRVSGSTRLADGLAEVERRRILFVGSMDYHANEDAAVYFANKVWPDLKKRWPKLEFTIVGRRPSVRIKRLSSIEGVEVTGTVHDVRPYYREAIAVVVPLRVGGGSRLKILEAMAAGVPVVSTTLGAEGLDVTDSKNMLFADSEMEFVRALSLVCEDAAVWRMLSVAGRDLAHLKYSWRTLGRACEEIHQLILDVRWKPLGGKPPVPVVNNSDSDWANPGQWVQEHGKIG
jgi:glycosyltransferase involved in cell wall biosynthesis